MIKDILKELNIESEALGGSSGEYWFGNGKSISSPSLLWMVKKLVMSLRLR